MAAAGTNLFAATNSGVFVSANNEASWALSYGGITTTVTYCFMTDNNKIYAGTANGIYVSTNNGSQWSLLYRNFNTSSVYSLAISGNNMYAGTRNGTVWTNTSYNLSNKNIRAMAALGSNIIAGSNGSGIFVSTNNGATWMQKTSSNLSSFTVAGNDILAACNDGLNISTNNGVNWTKPFTLPNNYFYSVAVSDNYVFIGTQYDAVWCGPVSEVITGIKGINGNMPETFALEQNYPTPFNPVTVINYNIQKAGKVTLKIYNLLSREVATLVNGDISEGTHSVEFNASGLPSGMYLYELRSNESVSVKKMMYLK